MMQRIKLILEYDGRAFGGFQVQHSALGLSPQISKDENAQVSETARTVQGELELALFKITGQPIRIVGASRTDAGVHALGQVVHFDWPGAAVLSPERIVQALNALLPHDVNALEASHVPHDFHAQVQAQRKHYRYCILNRLQRSAVLRNTHWHVRFALNLQAMQSAARRMEGTHDLSAFTVQLERIRHERAAKGATPLETVRTLYEVVVSERQLEYGREIIVDVTGSGFLYKMVRTIVGTLIEVGRGKRPPEWIDTLLTSKDRTQAGQTAPAKGLTLMKIYY